MIEYLEPRNAEAPWNLTKQVIVACNKKATFDIYKIEKMTCVVTKWKFYAQISATWFLKTT